MSQSSVTVQTQITSQESAERSLLERAKHTGLQDLIPIINSALKLSRELHQLYEDDLNERPHRAQAAASMAVALRQFDALWSKLDESKMRAYRPFVIQAAYIWSAPTALAGLFYK